MDITNMFRAVIDQKLTEGRSPHETFADLHKLLDSLRHEFCGTPFNTEETRLLERGQKIEAIKAYRTRMMAESQPDTTLRGAVNAMNKTIDILHLGQNKIHLSPGPD